MSGRGKKTKTEVGRVPSVKQNPTAVYGTASNFPLGVKLEKTTQGPKAIDESREIPALVLIFWPLIGLGHAIRIFDGQKND